MGKGTIIKFDDEKFQVFDNGFNNGAYGSIISIDGKNVAELFPESAYLFPYAQKALQERAAAEQTQC